uniref:large ribosomal subunit protein uL30-like 1 isoform X1 n=1 Tax=Myxine glutinosa TaxID=7769 RepID=UPI00358FE9AF
MADVHLDMPVKRLPKVPENLLKKRKKYQGLKESYKRSDQHLKRRRNAQKLHFKRPESFVRDSRQRHRDSVRLARLARKPASLLPMPTCPRLVFALRIRSANSCCLAVRQALQFLRLTRIFSGVFLKLSRGSLTLLRRVEPYIAWGYPNLKSVRELILKRGRTMVQGRSTPLTDNCLVEAKLGFRCCDNLRMAEVIQVKLSTGKHDVICLEDVIHEVFSLGPHFKVSSLFLHPFMLPVVRHSRRNRTRQALETGPCGDRGSAINELIRKLN